MKYGRLVYFKQYSVQPLCNIGDLVQCFAVDLIYQKMNVGGGTDVRDLEYVPVEELGTYKGNGEKVLLPINGYLRYNSEHPAFPTSKDIIPIFLSIHTWGRYLRYKEFWSSCGPIGCRDEATMLAMRKKGYEAYLLGCVTMLFPRRKEEPSDTKVFLVDAHPAVEEYIPERFRPYIERVTHEIPVTPELDRMAALADCERRAREQYARYAHEATLVVTSRLHCAAPCIAMGIPTIVVRDGFDRRYGWLDRFTHLYTPDEYGEIDWDPKPVECEEFKDKLMRAVISLIKQEPDRELLREIHDDLTNREKKKLGASPLVEGYMFACQYFPRAAEFVRSKLLRKLTITKNSSPGR